MIKPNIRFPEFTDSYEEEKLSHYLKEQKDRNKKNEYKKQDVFSVSRTSGIVNQIEYLGKSMAGQDLSNYHIVYPSNVVYTKSPLKETPYGIIKHNNKNSGIVSTLYAVYECNDDALPAYIDYYFSFDDRVNRYLKPLVNIGAKHDMKINNEDALAGIVCFPSIAEQRKVVTFLNIYESKIQNQSLKVKTLEERRKGLLQQIFSQKIRFKTDDGGEFPNWEERPMGNFFTERKEKSKGGEELLSVTIANGVIRQSDSEKRDSSSENKSNYKLVMKGDIAYNTMRMWQGAEGVSYWDGIVSPAYTVIIPNDGINSEFFQILFKTHQALKKFTIYSQGLSSDNWNLKFETFAELEFAIPCDEEQRKIVEFFKLIDKQIQVERNKLKAIKNIKKGLLQQMFV